MIPKSGNRFSEQIMPWKSVDVARGRHVGFLRHAACRALDHPQVTPLLARMRRDGENAREPAARLTRRSFEHFRIFCC
jgi:hypothetical protein